MLSLELAFTALCAWVILQPRRYMDSINGFRRLFGRVQVPSNMPLRLVRVAGFILLGVFWFAVLSSAR
jgi:hypothetical protein